jgi:MipA family protein
VVQGENIRISSLISTVVVAVAVAAVPLRARAADATTDLAPESPWRIGLAFGYGERSNPLVQSEDIPILVDVDIAWFGERWFFDNGDVGLTFLDGERITLNAIGRFNSDRVFFSKTDTKYVALGGGSGPPFTVAMTSDTPFVGSTPIEVPDRDYAFELGVELLSDGDWGSLEAAAHRDASHRHDGYELHVSYGYSARRQRWFIEPSVGLSYKSERLNDYYWGVRPEESNLLLPQYSADAGVNPHARLAARYQLTRNWTFVVAAQYERLNGDAARSPLVEDRAVRSGFAGFNYGF